MNTIFTLVNTGTQLGSVHFSGYYQSHKLPENVTLSLFTPSIFRYHSQERQLDSSRNTTNTQNLDLRKGGWNNVFVVSQ